MKVMLLFPPHWTPAMPHLALPSLAGYLRAHGVEVVQRDLNVEVFDRVLSVPYLQEAVARLHDDALRGAERPAPRERVEWALACGPALAAQVEAAAATMRGAAFFDGARGLEAFLTVVQALELASLPYYPASLGLTSFVPPMPVDHSRSLLEAVGERSQNMFLPLFEDGVIADVERERPDIVGISIATMDQMLAATTLAHLIKQAGLPCHITAGGPHVTMLREALPRVPALFELFDSAVTFAGELPLLRLAEALAGRGDLSQVPGLIYRRGPRIRVVEPGEPEELASLPAPDFDGLPLDRYLAPELVLPLATPSCGAWTRGRRRAR